MAINIQAKTDYSYLFSSLTSNKSGGTNLNFLSDYAAIKNGSYAKLLKAYYNSDSNDAVKGIAGSKTASTSVTDADKKALTKVQTSADALKESADVLMNVGEDSVFNKKSVTSKDENGVETTTKEYDTDKIYKAVKSFVDDYNSVINAVDDAGNDKVTNRAVSMANATGSNENLLGKMGITINEDATLSIDEKTFKAADMTTVKSLFNGTGSFGYRISAQASMIDFAADSEASKNNTYTVNATLDTTGSVGNLFSTYF